MNTTTTEEIAEILSEIEASSQSPKEEPEPIEVQSGRDNGMTEPLREAIGDKVRFQTYLAESEY